MDDGDQFTLVEVLTYEVAACRRRLGREAAALPRRGDVVAHLELRDAVDFLPRHAAVSDEVAGMRLDDPEPVPVLGIVPLIPFDPLRRLLAGLRRGVEPHDVGIAQHRSHRVEVGSGHPAEAKSLRISGKHLSTIADRLARGAGQWGVVAVTAPVSSPSPIFRPGFSVARTSWRVVR